MQKKRSVLRYAALAVGVAVLSVAMTGGASPALANAETDPLQRLVELSVEEISVTEMRMRVEETAAEMGLSYDEVLTGMLAEAEANLSVEYGVVGDMRPFSSGGGGGSAPSPRNVPEAERAGDIFHSWAQTCRARKTLCVTHNHVGLYRNVDQVVEAYGEGEKSSARHINRRLINPTVRLLKVETTKTKRDAAAKHAFDKLRDKDYDSDWARSVSNGSGKLNCSELVWRAYKESSARLDVGNNPRFGVYPNDILKSSVTTTYKTFTK
jgi:hypothetical protein